MPKHETVELKETRTVAIDKAIAPLVSDIWEAGISTRMSCEGDAKNCVWIQFTTASELERFLKTQGVTLSDVYSSISVENLKIGTSCCTLAHGFWRFRLSRFIKASVKDAEVLVSQAKALLESDVNLGLLHGGGYLIDSSVRFPRSELDQVHEKLKVYNTKSALRSAKRKSDSRPPASSKRTRTNE